MLALWMPFNNSTVNQGLDAVTVSGTPGYSSGKVTNYCYNSANQLTINVPTLKACTEFSVAYWIKISSSLSSDWSPYIKLSDGSSWIRFEACGSSNYKFTLYLCNNTDYKMFTNTVSSTAGKDIWIHYVVTYSKSADNIKLYVNGKLTQSVARGTCNGDTSLTGAVVVGYSAYNYINDLRIYTNEILSGEQAHELSKGLCLHYKMNKPCPNLIPVYSSCNSNGGTWVLDSTSNLSLYRRVFRCTAASTSDNSGLWFPTYSLATSGTYTMSFRVRIRTSSSTTATIGWESVGTKSIATNSWYDYRYTTTITAGHNTIFYWNSCAVGDTVEIEGFKLEAGYNPTPWIPKEGLGYYEPLGIKRTDDSLFANSLYHGLAAEAGCSSSQSMTKTRNADGSYKYKMSYTGTGSNAWFSIQFPTFSFTSGTTYVYLCKVRVNSYANVSFSLRASRCSNDYATNMTNVLAGGVSLDWVEYGSSATCLTTLSGTASTTGSPRLEFYTSTMATSGTVYSFDIDIKDVRIYTAANYYNQTDIEDDTSGLRHYAQMIGEVAHANQSLASPRYDSCYYFNLGTNHLRFATPIPSAPSYMTVAFWIKPDSSNGGYDMVAGNYDNPSSGFWIATNCEGFGLWYYSSGLYIRALNGTTLTNGTWYHIALVYSNGSWQWYLNGTAQTTSVSTTSKAPILTSYLSIGNSYTGSSWNTKCYSCMSDFRIYATALSADDICALYKKSGSVDNKGNILIGELKE